jgi:hypothetical protein
MVPVCKLHDAVELALMESALNAHGIPYFVHNRGFGGLYPGPQIDLYNVQTIMTSESAVDEAREVLAELIQSSEEAGISDARRFVTLDKIRLIAEALLAGWFVPRRGPAVSHWRAEDDESRDGGTEEWS